METGSGATIVVDTRGEKCPKPLLKTRDAIRRAPRGAVIEVLGTHAPSKREVQLAAKAVGAKVIAVEDEGDFWKVVMKLPE